MSSPEPAPKQTRQDNARQVAVTRPGPESQSQGVGASAAQVEANGQAGDAATGRMVADGEANHDSRWMQVAHGVADGAQIVGEIIRLALFNPFTGVMEGNLELGKALYYAQLVAPIQALQMITLNAAHRGSNPVHVKLNLYHKTFDLTAAQLAIAGFHTGTATGHACELSGLTAHAQAGQVQVQIASATLHDVTFIRGDQQVRANDVGLRGLAVSGTQGAQLATSLHFHEAHIHGLRYPNAAPLDLDLPGGTTLDAVWQHGPSTPSAAPAGPQTAPGALPTAPDVLPPGSRVQIELAEVQASGVLGGDHAGGQGGFGHLRLALVKDGADLASIVITGFHAGGGASAAAATIDKIVLTGAPNLVDALLSNQAVATDPHVRAAIQLVQSAKLRPSVSGSVTLSHLSLSHGANQDAATGDFASTLALPGVGTLDLHMTKFSLASGAGQAGSFAHFDATLRDEAGKELGHVDLEGGAANNTTPDQRKGAVSRFSGRGDVAGIVRAGDAIVQQLPLTVRAGLGMVRALGVKGDISGSLTATATKNGATEIAGSFTAHLAAGAVGSVAITVTDFRGNETTSADATFRDFKTTLTNPRGHVVADIHIANGGFVAGKVGTKFKAGKIEAKGDSPSVMAMINAVAKESSSLSPPVSVAFDLVRSYYVGGGGGLALAGVAIDQNAAGGETVHLQNAAANFKLGTGEAVDVTVAGVNTAITKAGTDVQFDRFTASLVGAGGAGSAKILVERGGATIAPAKAGAAPDLTVHSHHATFDGQATDISKLVGGIRAHLTQLPPPIARVFDSVARYASSQTATQAIDVHVAADDLSIAQSKGATTAGGDLGVSVAVTGGTANLQVHGFAQSGKDMRFAGLDLSVQDPGGATATSLRVGATHLDAAGAVTVASISASGDGARLRSVIDGIGVRVPPAISQALAAVGTSHIDAAISSIAVAPTADGGLITDAAVVRVSGAVSVVAGGSKYQSPNAAIALYGTHVKLGPDKKPREIDATSMDVSGAFTSAGAGRAIDGQATLHVGASKIVLDAHGKVTEVQTSHVQIAGDVTTQTTEAPAAAPRPAAIATAPRAPGAPDATTAEAVAAAQSIKFADIRTHTPIVSGRYGAGLAHIDVPAGATIHTSLEVRDYSLATGTRVVIQPKLEAYWLKAAGVDLETAGTEGVLKARVDGLFGFSPNITKFVVGQKALSLDLGTLVGQVMSNLRKGIDTAAQTAEKTKPPTTANPDEKAKLARRHDDWARGRHPDAAEEPRSMAIGDLATKGIQVAATTGTGDVEVASRDGKMEAHLHGEAAGGGVMQLGVSDANVQVGGQTIQTKGLETGPVDIQTSPSATHVSVSGFSIEALRWLGG